MKVISILVAIMIAFFCLFRVQGAVSISDLTTYSQNFDALPGSGSMPWENDVSLPGWYLFKGVENPAQPISSITAGEGTNTGGGAFSYGKTGSSDRAIGSTGSGTIDSISINPDKHALSYAVAFTNNTSNTIGSFCVNFSGEQWRTISGAPAQSLEVRYGVMDFWDWTKPWSPLTQFVSPVFGQVSTSKLDGNNPINRTENLGGMVFLDWQPGQTLWITFDDLNDPGTDHAFAIDDFSFTPFAVPEPSFAGFWVAPCLLVFLLRKRKMKNP